MTWVLVPAPDAAYPKHPHPTHPHPAGTQGLQQAHQASSSRQGGGAACTLLCGARGGGAQQREREPRDTGGRGGAFGGHSPSRHAVVALVRRVNHAVVAPGEPCELRATLGQRIPERTPPTLYRSRPSGARSGPLWTPLDPSGPRSGQGLRPGLFVPRCKCRAASVILIGRTATLHATLA